MKLALNVNINLIATEVSKKEFSCQELWNKFGDFNQDGGYNAIYDDVS
jgi:hypothetical protein